MCRAFFCAFAAADTFTLINMSHILGHRDRSLPTNTGTKTATKATRITGEANGLSLLAGGATHGVAGLNRDQFNQAVGTNRHANATSSATGRIYKSTSVDHRNGFKRAGCGTGAKACASISTGFSTPSGCECNAMAIAISKISIAEIGLITGPRTLNKGNTPLAGGRL